MKHFSLLLLMAGLLSCDWAHESQTVQVQAGTLSGTVLGSPTPVSGATVTVSPGGYTARTTAHGFFEVENIPVGTYTVHVSGADLFNPTDNSVRLADKAGIEFPSIGVALGANAVAGRPIFLPELAVGIWIDTVGTNTATIAAGTRIGNDALGVFLDFEASTTATFPNSSRTTISITDVPIEQIPMDLPPGTTATTVMTIQPGGATFSPAPRVTFPNTNNVAAGTTGVAMVRFDHDQAQWIQFDTGTVTADGESVIGEKNSAYSGMIESGWNGTVVPPFCNTTVTGTVVAAGTNTGIPGIQIVTVNAAKATTAADGSFTISNVPVPRPDFQLTVTAAPGSPNSGYGAAASPATPVVCAGTTLVGTIELPAVTIDTTAPSVLTVSPADQTVNVPGTTTVQLIFSEVLSPGSVTASSVKLSTGSSNVDGILGVNGSTVVFLPLAPLSTSTIYTVTVTTAVEDQAGNKLDGKFTSQFLTESTASTGTPTVSVTPSTPSLTVGTTQQFTAAVQDASAIPVPGAQVVWASSDPAVASINGTGLATSLTGGTTTMTASVTVGTTIVTDSASLTVTTPTVSTVVITPATQTLPVAGVQQFFAEARDTGGNPIPGVTFSWVSSNATVAAVSPFGNLLALTPGTTTLQANSTPGSIVGSATITVVATSSITSVTVTPPVSNLLVNGAGQLAAMAKDSAGTTIPGAIFTWSSSNTSVATVNSFGMLTAVATGTATITATTSGQSGTATVNVVVPTNLAITFLGGVLESDPISGVRVLRHDATTGAYIEERTSNSNGVADFGDINTARTTITCVTTRTNETDLFTLVSIPTSNYTLLADTDPATQATVSFTLTGIPGTATQGVVQIGDYEEDGLELQGTVSSGTASVTNAIVDRLQIDGKFSVLTYGRDTSNGSITGIGFAADLVPATVNNTNVNIITSIVPSTVPYTANVALKPSEVFFRRKGVYFTLWRQTENLTAASSGTFQYLPGNNIDRFDFVAEIDETPTAAALGQDRIFNAVPGSIHFTLPTLVIAPPVWTQTTNTIAWNVSGTSSSKVDAIATQLVWLAGATRYEWEFLQAAGNSNVVLPGLPTDLTSIVVPPTTGVSVSVEAIGLDVAQGYDDLLGKINSFNGNFETLLFSASDAFWGERTSTGVVVKINTGVGSVLSTPSGIDTSTGQFSTSFPGGTAVTLTAIPGFAATTSWDRIPQGGAAVGNILAFTVRDDGVIEVEVSFF